MARKEQKNAKLQKEGEADFKVGVFQEFFGTKNFTYRQEIDRIDFIITDNYDRHLIWAETKKNTADVIEMFVQLILTIGKGRTFDKYTPPPFLCVFDYIKIAFLQYNEIQDVFYQNDFNWNITPSDYKSKEFIQIKNIIEKTVNDKNLLFTFESDKLHLIDFIKCNFKSKTNLFSNLISRIQIDKNNFIPIYNRWIEIVKPSIAIDWDLVKRKGIIDGDFYLADLLSLDNVTLKDKLFVLLKENNYELDRQIDDMGLFTSKSVAFKDKGLSHKHFWELYIRPPKEEYWEYIIKRRDLLVPQDIRERKGSYFTPQIWVQKSQEYLSIALGEDWQDEYYIWDCAAGTGNLLAGLTNKYHIWASTLDKADVDVMKDRIKNGANLLEEHVFQFDFLNDDVSKLPNALLDIIKNENKCKKLIIYINPPYAEASKMRTLESGKEGIKGVEQSEINKKYGYLLGQGKAELFVQFFTRIYQEMKGCILAEFSTFKIISGQHFIEFRNFFFAGIKKAFVCPANTFDNVKGSFPIGFFIWDTSENKKIDKVITDIYNEDASNIGIKTFFSYDNSNYINDWIKPLRGSKTGYNIGKFPFKGNDFQNQNLIAIVHPNMDYNVEAGQFLINANNLIAASVYFAVRKVIPANWLNDRDQFLHPDNNWETDTEFQNDCLTYTIFNNQVQLKYGINHWIPFTEEEVDAKNNFESHFLTDFIKGKIKINENDNLFSELTKKHVELNFSDEANIIFSSGKKLWKYYHSISTSNVNAGLYDIREFFQGRNNKGKMNLKSSDEQYNAIINELRTNLKNIALKIQPKIYMYGFLLN